jgi:antitoxin ChpS
MAIVNIRRQGGAAIMTLPAEALKALGVDVGAKLEIEVVGGAITARPAAKSIRRRYSLRELLRGATPDAMCLLNDDTAWAREGDPVGREL